MPLDLKILKLYKTLQTHSITLLSLQKIQNLHIKLIGAKVRLNLEDVVNKNLT